MHLLNTAVVAIFVSHSQRRSLCPLIDILADNRYFQNAGFKSSRQGRKKQFLLVRVKAVTS